MTAYAFYDVFDQYGESMRDAVSITWTSSAGTITADKSTGRLKISKSAGTDEFMYGSLLYVVGVDTANGLSVQKQLTVGMERAVDTITFDGFVSKDAKSKKTDIQETLPVDFAKDTWMLLYTAKDQNGNVMDATGTRKTDSEINFLSNNPMLVTMDFTDYGAPVTIEGVDYDAVWVQPGMYVDKGGEVMISALSNKTGVKTDKVFTIGVGGILKSVILSQPKDAVADGDKDVKIPYKATDVNGNDVTDFETIARSTNSLKLNAADSELYLKEENDGTAGFYWTDSKTVDYTSNSFSDGMDRPVALTTIVVGGDSNNFMLTVSDARIPAAISAVSANSKDADAFVAEARGSIDIVGTGSHEKISYKDQYGKDLDAKKAKKFFRDTAPGVGDYNNYHYGVMLKATTTNAATLGLGWGATATEQVYYANATYTTKTVTKDDWKGTTTVDTETVGTPGKQVISMTATGSAVTSNSVTFAIAKVKNANDDSGNPLYQSVNKWETEGKKVTKTYEVAPMSEVKNLDLASIARLGVTTNNTNAANGDGLTMTALAADADGATTFLPVDHGKNTISLTGTIKGITVDVPAQYYTDVSPATAGAIVTSGDITGVQGLSWGDLYDANSAKNIRKDATAKVALNVYSSSVTQNPSTLMGTPSRNFKVSDALAAPASVSFVANWNGILTEYTYKPTYTKLANGWDDTYDFDNKKFNNVTAVSDVLHDGLYGGAGMNEKPGLYVLDQYGDVMINWTATECETYTSYNTSGSNLKPIFTVSDLKENSAKGTHAADSLKVNKNGSSAVEIEGAEPGDTFTLTGYVDGYPDVTATLNVTVGTDNKAIVSSNDGNNTDKKLRSTFLGYDKDR